MVHKAEVKWPDEEKIARRASRLSKRSSALSEDSPKSKRLSKASSSTPRKKSTEDSDSSPHRKHRHKENEDPSEQTEQIGEGENQLKKHRPSKRKSKVGKQLSLDVEADVEMNAAGSPMTSIQESSEPKTPIAPTPVEEKPSQPVPAPVIHSRYPLTLENTDEFGFDKSSSPSESHSISST